MQEKGDEKSGGGPRGVNESDYLWQLPHYLYLERLTRSRVYLYISTQKEIIISSRQEYINRTLH